VWKNARRPSTSSLLGMEKRPASHSSMWFAVCSMQYVVCRIVCNIQYDVACSMQYGCVECSMQHVTCCESTQGGPSWHEEVRAGPRRSELVQGGPRWS
jgi:hypothetical protein